MKLEFIFYVNYVLLLFKLYYCRSTSKVLLISLDGFRHDYLELAKSSHISLPNFDKIISKGYKASKLKPTFFTKTFPNHVSIITGCYQEVTGIISNSFYDPVFNDTFSIKKYNLYHDYKWFNHSEPIWLTNIKNGYHSADIYWPGQQVIFQNKYVPSYSFGYYSKNLKFKTKIDFMFRWLEKDRTTFGQLYHPEPDGTGHKYGPKSQEVLKMIKSLDDTFGYLLNKLKRSKLKDMLNIIIVSDHGMAEVTNEKRINMDDFIPPSLYHTDYSLAYTCFGLWPKNDSAYKDIIKLGSNIKHTKLFEKKNYPKRWYWSNNRRIPPIIILAEKGWVLVDNNNSKMYLKGDHGYDNTYSDMEGIFMAFGPDIIHSKQMSVIRNIDIYPLIARILKLKDLPPINGSLSNVKWLIQTRVKDEYRMVMSFVVLIIVAVVSALAACIMITCAHLNIKYTHSRNTPKAHVLSLKSSSRHPKNSIPMTQRQDKNRRNSKFNPDRNYNQDVTTQFLLDDYDDSDDESSDDILAEVVTKPKSGNVKKSMATSAK